ncbi:MAG: hypothetical protein AB1Z98_25610 [Nannocystaceae bacterium]
MKLCLECDRHLFGPEPQCPFCGAAQPTTGALRSPVAAISLAFGLSLASCGPQAGTDSTGNGSADSSGTTDPTATTAMTTVAMTTSTTSATGTDSGTTAASDTIDDAQDEAPCAFYAGCPPEDGGTFDFECDMFAQDCPAGEKCMPWSNDGDPVWNATRCSPIADNPDGLDEPCTVEGSATSGLDSCDLGLLCWGVDSTTNEGECIAMCGGSPGEPVCEPDQTCSISNDGALVLCLDTCDPLMQDCPTGEGCYGTTLGEFVCSETLQPGTWGQPCEQFADCDPGSVCVGGFLVPGCATAECCTDFCDLAAPDTCPGSARGVTCESWYRGGMPQPGYDDVGACVDLP